MGRSHNRFFIGMPYCKGQKVYLAVDNQMLLKFNSRGTPYVTTVKQEDVRSYEFLSHFSMLSLAKNWNVPVRKVDLAIEPFMSRLKERAGLL